jgi:hypothetical protein
MKLFLVIAGIFFIIALLIAFHQWLNWGVWFSWEDLHHETWMVMFAFSGFILLMVKK